MTVRELINVLKTMPQDESVVIQLEDSTLSSLEYPDFEVIYDEEEGERKKT